MRERIRIVEHAGRGAGADTEHRLALLHDARGHGATDRPERERAVGIAAAELGGREPKRAAGFVGQENIAAFGLGKNLEKTIEHPGEKIVDIGDPAQPPSDVQHGAQLRGGVDIEPLGLAIERSKHAHLERRNAVGVVVRHAAIGRGRPQHAIVKREHGLVDVNAILIAERRATRNLRAVDIRAVETVEVLDEVAVVIAHDAGMLPRDTVRRQHDLAELVATDNRFVADHDIAMPGRGAGNNAKTRHDLFSRRKGPVDGGGIAGNREPVHDNRAGPI